MKEEQTEGKAGDTLRVNEQKWGKSLLEAGWTCFPSVIIERQRVIGLDAMDINILLHLAMYWWNKDGKPHPSKSTIANAMNVDQHTIQRRIAQMEKSGLLKREERRLPGKGSRTNLYHLDGLIEVAKPYAEERVQEVADKEAERRKRAARRGKAKLRVVASQD